MNTRLLYEMVYRVKTNTTTCHYCYISVDVDIAIACSGVLGDEIISHVV